MSLGIYFHIPYCIQRCTYCDFATYEQSQILPPEQYVAIVQEEMRQKLPSFSGRQVDTVYFGGGTPSLIPAELIVDLMESLEKHGLKIKPDAERTLEINPATLNPKKIELYLRRGINRFSVGAQTFNDALLRSVRREHSAEQTRDTLRLLKQYAVNYSFDLLFALPNQSLEILQADLDEVELFEPPHVSAYCLTVPEGHVLAKQRLADETQVEMFKIIENRLKGFGLNRYEISNFAKPGFESRHNSLYWDDSEYLGFGLSAHSYVHGSAESRAWGIRFWNQSSIGAYADQVKKGQGRAFSDPYQNLEPSLVECLEIHQSLTDFCHIFLRTQSGLSQSRLRGKFGPRIAQLVQSSLEDLVDRGWVVKSISKGDICWALSPEGLVVSNQVFAALTYLSGELPTP